VRWISTVALQANLQGEDGTGEGENGSEGARTPGGGGPRLVRRARTPVEGGAYAWLGGRAHLGGAHACGRGCVRLVGRAHMPGGGTRTPRRGGTLLERGARMPREACT
jgi:hypothetical protein